MILTFKQNMAFALSIFAASVVTAGEGTGADDRRHNSTANTAVVCPCSLDEPLIGVQSQIKNNPGSWIAQHSPVLDSAVLANKWYRLNLYKNGKKRHSFEQKLGTGQAVNSLRCTWVKWSDIGVVENKIGMGYYLYGNATDAAQALNACFKKIAKPISTTTSKPNDKNTLTIHAATVR